MNILTLSPEQKTKLLELCKQFIPEYTWRMDPADRGCLEFSDEKRRIEFIHWYQLCVTELCERITKHFELFDGGKGEYVLDYYICHLRYYVVDEKHPVDFLYKFWKNDGKLNDED